MSIKKLLLLSLLCVAPAFGQNARYDNIATKISSSGNVVPVTATITVCTSAGTGQPCTPKANLCLNASDTTCNQSNPFTSDSFGNYGFWVAPGTYIVTLTGSGFTASTMTVTLPCIGGSSCTHSGTETFSNIIAALPIGVTVPTTSNYFQFPTNEPLTAYNAWTTVLTPANQIVAGGRSRIDLLHGGQYGSIQTINVGHWLESNAIGQGQSLLAFGFSRQLGKGNTNLYGGIAYCANGGGLTGAGSIGSCGWGESDYLIESGIFQATLSGAPGSGATTLTYTGGVHETGTTASVGERTLLNNTTGLIVGNGTTIAITNMTGTNVTFTGTALANPASGNYYLKVGTHTADLGAPTCPGDDTILTNVNQTSDNKCVGHWYPITITGATTATIAGSAQWDSDGLHTPGAARSIRSIVGSAGTATVRTTKPHNFYTNDSVAIASVNATYNGTFTITVTDAWTFTYALAGTNPEVDFTGTATLQKADFLIVQGVEITNVNTAAHQLTVTANSWNWNNNDVIYSPASSIMGWLGGYHVFYKQYRTRATTAPSFAYSSNSIGTSPLNDFLFAQGNSTGGYANILRVQSSAYVETGIDFSSNNFRNFAFAMAQDTGGATANYFCAAGCTNRFSHDGSYWLFNSTKGFKSIGSLTTPGTFANNDIGDVHVEDTSTANATFAKLTFRNAAASAGANAAIGAKTTASGTELHFGTSNSFPGVTNDIFWIDPTGNISYGEKTGTAVGIASAATLAASSDDHLLYQNENNGGAQPVGQRVILTSQYTNSTTGFTTVGGFSFPVAASRNYTLECHLYYQAAATGGLNIQFTGPAAATAITYGLNDPSAATTFNSAVATAFSTSLGQVVGTAATNFDATVSLGLVNGANAGTIVLQAKSSAAVQLQIQAGSFCRFQ